MEIKKVVVGQIKTNCYILSAEDGVTFVLDPGADAAKIEQELEKIPNLNLKYILLTHAHFDHVLAVDELKIKYPKADIVIHEKDLKLLHNLPSQGLYTGQVLGKFRSEVVTVTDGSYLPFADTNIKVFSTPGHSMGSVCYLFNDILFSGDMLFWHTIGRTDLPESDDEKMKLSLSKILRLPADTYVLPGHGKATSIGEENKFWKYNY